MYIHNPRSCSNTYISDQIYHWIRLVTPGLSPCTPIHYLILVWQVDNIYRLHRCPTPLPCSGPLAPVRTATQHDRYLVHPWPCICIVWAWSAVCPHPCIAVVVPKSKSLSLSLLCCEAAICSCSICNATAMMHALHRMLASSCDIHVGPTAGFRQVGAGHWSLRPQHACCYSY